MDTKSELLARLLRNRSKTISIKLNPELVELLERALKEDKDFSSSFPEIQFICAFFKNYRHFLNAKALISVESVIAIHKPHGPIRSFPEPYSSKVVSVRDKPCILLNLLLT